MSGITTDVAYLTRALKMTRARQVAASLAETARAEGWDYTEFLAKVLTKEVASRETHGGENRMKAARFPHVKTLDDFDYSHQRSVSRQQISHLHQLDFLREPKNVIFLGPPGTGKIHLSIALSVQTARRGHRVAFTTATEWVLRLSEAKRAGKLTDELERLGRIPLRIVDEVGYIPFDPEAASLFFSMVSSRYERSPLIVSSNKNFSPAPSFLHLGAEVLGDRVLVSALHSASRAGNTSHDVGSATTRTWSRHESVVYGRAASLSASSRYSPSRPTSWSPASRHTASLSKPPAFGPHLGRNRRQNALTDVRRRKRILPGQPYVF